MDAMYSSLRFTAIFSYLATSFEPRLFHWAPSSLACSVTLRPLGSLGRVALQNSW